MVASSACRNNRSKFSPCSLNGLATSQLTEAAATGEYSFPTAAGLNFEALLLSLGVPAAPNRDQIGSGILPASYPASW